MTGPFPFPTLITGAGAVPAQHSESAEFPGGIRCPTLSSAVFSPLLLAVPAALRRARGPVHLDRKPVLFLQPFLAVGSRGDHAGVWPPVCHLVCPGEEVPAPKDTCQGESQKHNLSLPCMLRCVPYLTSGLFFNFYMEEYICGNSVSGVQV